jgi:gluconolactonase
VFDDAGKELPFSGVYRVRDGEIALESDDLEGPNGLALSPDERYLYVGNWDLDRKIIMRYDVGGDGRLSNGTVFHDMTDAPGEDALDGLKVDRAGNVYACGPGGIWVLSPDGERLGLLKLPEDPRGATTAGRST